MKPPTEHQAAPEIIDLLAELFGISPQASPQAIRLNSAARSAGYDYSIALPGHRLLAEYKNVASAGPLANALPQLKQAAEADPDGGLPLMVVPFMGEVGRKLCEEFGIAWMDLSGNAYIVAPGLRIRIEGRPNKFLERGRPSNAFAPKSSRVARQLLAEPRRFQAQVELARQTGLGDGYVSKIVRRLAQEHYLDANAAGAVRPRDPNLLLGAWHAAYDFNRHRILKGSVPARTGDEVVHRIAGQLSQAQITYAMTGISAAALYLKLAEDRLATVYVPALPSRALLQKIEFVEERQGGNLWFVVPGDAGVFDGSQEQAGVCCVSPLQAYLDLKCQPERAKDAAVELCRKFLKWRRHEK